MKTLTLLLIITSLGVMGQSTTFETDTLSEQSISTGCIGDFGIGYYGEINLTHLIENTYRGTLATTFSNKETSTFMLFGSSNNLVLGVCGEDVRLKDKTVSQTGYLLIGKQFKDCISIMPMLGYGTSHYNKRMAQVGVLASVRVKFISIGVMYNTTSKFSLVAGISLRLN